jgi:hypothetical protein
MNAYFAGVEFLAAMLDLAQHSHPPVQLLGGWRPLSPIAARDSRRCSAWLEGSHPARALSRTCAKW